MTPDGDKDRGPAYPGITGAVGVVTGAAQGIGEAVARALAWHGASVMIVDKEGDRAERLAAELGRRGMCAAFARVDVSDAAAVESMIVQAELQLGPIDILVNAAGVLRTGPVVDTDERDWCETFAANATGVFLVSRAVAKRMISRRCGSIVTVGSNATAVVRTEMAAYAASKAAATAFTKCLGLELAAFGIRCNVVSPGSTDTPMQRALWTGPDAEASVIAGSPARFRSGIPLGKLARASEVAEAVLFLASDLASHVTMHDFCVDGGASLRG